MFLDDDISLTSYNTFQSINDLLRPDNIAQYAFKIVNYDDETMLTDCGIWNYNGLFHGGIFNGKYILQKTKSRELGNYLYFIFYPMRIDGIIC